MKTNGNVTRRAALAGVPAAAAVVLAGGTVANTVALAIPRTADVDPIFAVIERHRVAVAEYNKAEAISGNIVGGSQDWKVTWAVTSAAMDRKADLLEAVLRAQPTTMAGVIALLEHLGQDEFLGVDWGRDEHDRETLLSTFNNCNRIEPRRLAQDFPLRLAGALHQIIGTEGGDEAMITTAKRRPGAAKPDPIFAAIERERAAYAAYLATGADQHQVSDQNPFPLPDGQIEDDRAQKRRLASPEHRAWLARYKEAEQAHNQSAKKLWRARSFLADAANLRRRPDRLP
jgi:hypothetical protein